MQLHSVIFAVFFLAVFLLYWAARRVGVRVQNVLILVANTVFYGWWDYRFLSLLYGTALIDYGIGRLMADESRANRRKWLFGISLVVNLSLLGFFKYFNFFITSFAEAALLLGWTVDVPTLRILLPIGISFFTFQRLSYTIDLYRKQIPATKDIVAFLAFSGFFPLILAGPIERAKRLLPQFEKSRIFDYEKSKDALRQILWGLFKKIVIADNLAAAVDAAFNNYASLNGIDLGVGAFLFAVQIYADFSGYSDMALGIGKLLGIRIMRNFANPYFSRDIAEFWRRWHISMSSWFRDYVYTPLSFHVPFSDRWRRMRNILITFTVSGLWHGANWTFVFWGFLNGLFFAPLVFIREPQHEAHIVAEGRLLMTAREFLQVFITFLAVCAAWIFFRADTLTQAFSYFGSMLSHSWLALPKEWIPVLYSIGLLIFEWIQRERHYALEIPKLPVAVRWATYCVIILAIFVFGSFGEHGFFYVQF